MLMFRIVLAIALISGFGSTEPLHARRTVIDLGTTLTTSGYCSPATALFNSSDCAAQQLGFALQLGGQTYDSFFINSNGVLSLGSIQTQLFSNATDPSLTFGDYLVPVFSPSFVDGAVNFSNYDGQFVVRVVSSTSSLLQVAFFECIDPGNCGLETIDLGLGFEPSIFLTLQSLVGGGFSLAYNYDQEILGTQGTYGFNLPSTGLIEATGPLQNRTFVFDATGQLINAVPEPSSWLMMLGGFAMIGRALRRKRRLAMASQLA